MPTARKPAKKTDLSEFDREVLVTARLLVELTGPVILQKDGDAAKQIGRIAVEINTAALSAAAS